MLLLVVVCIGLLPIQMRAQKNSYIIPGEVWKDTDGNPINAHGGGLLYHDGTYYWYGEYKKGKTILPDWATWECYRTDVTGVGCYSSKDLLNWKFEGIVLPAVKEDPNHDLHPSKVLERPKVIYNKKTPDVSCCNFLPQIQQKRRFVLPLYHAKLLNRDYRIARFAPFCKRKTDFFAFCPQTAPFRQGFRCICTKDKKKTATSR